MLRTTAAALAGRAARAATRVRGGGGSAFPGLVAERIDPLFLPRALADVGTIVVVSGTNGKTTTTKMLVEVLRAHGKVVLTNATGSNFTRGVISALLPQLPWWGRVHADLAVFELDEAHALKFTEVLRPTHVLLLNVARDQLDRFAEIDYTAGLLATLAGQASDTVILNADDPFIRRAADRVAESVSVRWFGVDPSVADRLVEVREKDVRFPDDHVPVALGADDGVLVPQAEQLTITFGDSVADAVGPSALQQRGLAAMINATAATTTARTLLGPAFAPDMAARALASVRPPFGRGEIIDINGPLELVLVKNPASFTVALATYRASPEPTMIAINDADADGKDVSWLYDVDFASLQATGVAMVSGIRAYDMAVRLDYDDVDVADVEPDLDRALADFVATAPAPRRVFATYTAMMALRRTLRSQLGLAGFGEENS